MQDLHAYLWQDPAAVGQPPPPQPLPVVPAAAAGHHPQQQQQAAGYSPLFCSLVEFSPWFVMAAT